MNVAESSNLNRLLRYLLTPGTEREDEARQAALHLIERARRTLLSGLTPEDVAALWEADLERRRSDDDAGMATCRLCGCTDQGHCEGGCTWVPNPLGVDLCSTCLYELAVLYDTLSRSHDQGQAAGPGRAEP